MTNKAEAFTSPSGKSFTYEELTAGDSTPNVQGVCKDCGNGTLNNHLNPAFNVDYGQYDGDVELVVTCIQCGSEHVDIL